MSTTPNEMTDLIIGHGEVGSALYAVLSERRSFEIHDPPKGFESKATNVDWMHVSIPWSDKFVKTVASYAQRFCPKHIVIHSTVKIGTTRKIEREADYIPTYFSPIRGRHPNLTEALRRFPKWYAHSVSGQLDMEIEAYFARAGIQTRKAPNLEALELMKIWETTSFAVQLVMWMEIEREMKSLSGLNKVNLTAMKNWLWEKRKCYDGDIGLVPVLDVAPGPLGGHCLRSNIELGKEYFHPSLYEWLTKTDDMRKDE